MSIRRFSILIVNLIFAVVKNGTADSRKHNILQLLSNAEPPYIAMYYQKGRDVEENDLEHKVDLTENLSPDIDSLGPPYDQKAYLLYHALRTAEEREEIDQEAARNFEQTKQILRQALRKRCDTLSSCYRQCSVKYYYSCTVECRETYDTYDVCQPKKKKKICYEPKCGRTMPPAWLLRQG